MRMVLDPGKERRSVNFLDNICYSHVTDLEGKPLDLYLSLMVQNGNSEMRLASGRDDEVGTGRQPVVVWFNGAGWHSVEKNLMAAEMEFLAEAGFAVASIYYRGSEFGHFPDQLIDCKTAVRFLRSHADEYGLDPERIGVIGRSAGGFQAAWMAMNTGGFDSAEWGDCSSRVSAAVDMFGPVDLPTWIDFEQNRIDTIPNYRWHDIMESHVGLVLGGEKATLKERAAKASPVNAINPAMCPLMILHGDQDPLVPLSISEDFYRRLTDSGLEDRTELYILKNGGHGTREFFQLPIKKLITEFFTRQLSV